MMLPAIQSFVSADTSGANTSACLVDWANGRVYPYELAAPFAIERFVFSSGIQEAAGDLAGISSALALQINSLGYIYSQWGIAGVYSGIKANLATDFSLFGSFGTEVPFPGTNGPPNAIPMVGTLTALTQGNAAWLATASGIPFGTGGHAISVMGGRGVPTFSGHIFFMTSGAGNSWQQCVGMPGAGAAYTIESLALCTQITLYKTVIGAGAILYDPTTWPTPNAAIASSAVGTLLPSAIDATFDQITCTGIVCDQTDGNLLLQVMAGAGSPANNYIAKVSATSCALMWAVACPAPQMGVMMSRGIVKGGRYAVLKANGLGKQLTVINTLTGEATVTTTGFDDLLFVGAQCFNSEFGCVLGAAEYSGGTAPFPLGNTPSAFDGWAAIYVTSKIIPPYVPGGRVAYTKIWGAPAAT